MVAKEEPVEKVVVEIPSEEPKEEEKIEEPKKRKSSREQSTIQENNANHTTFGNEFITGANKSRFYNKNRCQTKST